MKPITRDMIDKCDKCEEKIIKNGVASCPKTLQEQLVCSRLSKGKYT